MYSLRRRLLISSALLLLVFLGVMGFGLNREFKRSVLSSAEDTLRTQVLLLMSGIEVVEGQVLPPPVLSEPRLQQPDSDLFAQLSVLPGTVNPVQQDQTRAIWRSPSLLDRSLPHADSRFGVFDFTASQAWSGLSINVMTLAVEWETDTGNVPFVIQVSESDKQYKRRLARYQRQVGVWLIFFGGALIVLLLGMLGWSLKPLERVRRQVNEIEEGTRKRFDEDYPTEVSRLTQNLNQLLNFEEQRIERHKEVLGNLAHSLKTPIAVLKGLKYDTQTHVEASEQLATMQTIIDYQLQSASAVGRRRFAKALDVSDITEQVVRSLEKLHLEKRLEVSLNIQTSTVFYGDQGDWMEVIGNLCDNAFKWSESELSINIENLDRTLEKKTGASKKTSIKIEVQDDGPGIDDALKHTILQRGVRLDSQTPGHGLGMHIVKGIVQAYEGELQIERSDFSSGTKFTVILN